MIDIKNIGNIFKRGIPESKPKSVASIVQDTVEPLNKSNTEAQDIKVIKEEVLGKISTGGSGVKAVGVDAVRLFEKNENRSDFIISSPLTNTGYLYIGFTNSLTTINFAICLDKGESWSCDDYRGEVWIIASAAGQLSNFGEW